MKTRTRSIGSRLGASLLVVISCLALSSEEDRLLELDQKAKQGTAECSGELRNTVDHLHECLREYVNLRVQEATVHAGELAPNLSRLVDLHYSATRGNVDPRSTAVPWPGREAYQRMERRFRSDAQALLTTRFDLVGMDISVEPFLTYLAVRRSVGDVLVGPEPRLDLKVSFLREQVGFFPEPYDKVVEDLDSYPQPQYAVYSKGPEIHVRVPVIYEGRYICDLAELFYHECAS